MCSLSECGCIRSLGVTWQRSPLVSSLASVSVRVSHRLVADVSLLTARPAAADCQHWSLPGGQRWLMLHGRMGEPMLHWAAADSDPVTCDAGIDYYSPIKMLSGYDTGTQMSGLVPIYCAGSLATGVVALGPLGSARRELLYTKEVRNWWQHLK